MFSVSYRKKAMIISAFNVLALDASNIEALRRLFIQVLTNPCRQIILDFKDIKIFEPKAIDTLNLLLKVAESKKVTMHILNVEETLHEQFNRCPELLRLFKPALKLNNYQKAV